MIIFPTLNQTFKTDKGVFRILSIVSGRGSGEYFRPFIGFYLRFEIENVATGKKFEIQADKFIEEYNNKLIKIL
jgi:hypothetical protein